MTGKKAGEAEEGAMGMDGALNQRAGSGESRVPPDGVRMVGARALLGERGVLRIEHHGEVYTLRITRNDRLILTK